MLPLGAHFSDRAGRLAPNLLWRLIGKTCGELVQRFESLGPLAVEAVEALQVLHRYNPGHWNTVFLDKDADFSARDTVDQAAKLSLDL